jgi:hypothetical protein
MAARVVRVRTAKLSATPLRAAATLLVVFVAVGLAWYLGSPLFVRTYRSDAAPAPASAAPRPADDAASAPATAATLVVAMGELRYVDAIHNGKGPVRIVDVGGERFVRFEDVALTNAPDVHVYLSRESGGKWTEATSLYLGPLKATNGSFNYGVPAGTDTAQYRSVVVWCRAFGVLISWADLG